LELSITFLQVVDAKQLALSLLPSIDNELLHKTLIHLMEKNAYYPLLKIDLGWLPQAL